MAKIWITGARGFIGRHLASWLAGRGHDVAGIGHGPWPQSEAATWGVRRWLNGDVHSSNLQQLLMECGTPDAIFHLAGGSSVGASVTSPHEDFARTVSTTAELLEWIRLQPKRPRLIATSSAAVYGAKHHGAMSEQLPCEPYSPYGHHKRMMEELCHSYAVTFELPIVICRLFSVYGPWLRKQLLWDTCTKLSSSPAEIQLGGTGAEVRDWTEVRDVVRALELTMTGKFSGEAMPILNLGSGVPTTIAEISRIVSEAWPTRTNVSFSGVSRPGDPFSLVADSSRLSSMGFEWKISVDHGVRDYVAWYLQHARNSI